MCVRVAARYAATVAFIFYIACISAERSSAKPIDVTTALFFSGADFWRNDAFGHAGLIWSPGGLNREGLALKAFVNTGTYEYKSGAADLSAGIFSASAMAGWHFNYKGVITTLLVGPDFQYDLISPSDLTRRRGAHLGIRTEGDLWWQPTDITMMNVSGSFSTIESTYWARGAFGYRVFNKFYSGPETQVLGDTGYSQLRFGIHVTAFRTGIFEWSASLGWANDTDDRSGIYGRIGLLTRR